MRSMRLLVFCVLSFCLLPSNSFSQTRPQPQIRTFYAEVTRAGFSFENYLADEIGIPQNLLYQEGYLDKIQKWNPQIKKTADLPIGAKLYIELPYGTLLRPKPKPQRITQTKNIRSQKNVVVAAAKKEEDFTLELFYQFSTGQFSQGFSTSNDQLVADQNTPFSMGVRSAYDFGNNYKAHGRLALSKLTRAQVANTSEDLDLPLEYQLDANASYQFARVPGHFYLGLGTEKISSYSFTNNDLPSVVDNSLNFLNIGYSNRINFLTNALHYEFIYSSVISSSNNSDSVDLQALSGSRFQAEISLRSESKWGYLVHYSKHSLTGSGDVSISRYGIGIAYRFL